MKKIFVLATIVISTIILMLSLCSCSTMNSSRSGEAGEKMMDRDMMMKQGDMMMEKGR